MNTRLLIPAILGAVMISTPILAAGPSGTATPATPHTTKAAAMTPAAKCTDLEKQVDAAMLKHNTAAKANEAKTLRAEGGQLCATGKHADGITKLEQALKDLGA